MAAKPARSISFSTMICSKRCFRMPPTFCIEPLPHSYCLIAVSNNGRNGDWLVAMTGGATDATLGGGLAGRVGGWTHPRLHGSNVCLNNGLLPEAGDTLNEGIALRIPSAHFLEMVEGDSQDSVLRDFRPEAFSQVVRLTAQPTQLIFREAVVL